jgi:hypothetical protein
MYESKVGYFQQDAIHHKIKYDNASDATVTDTRRKYVKRKSSVEVVLNLTIQERVKKT